MISFTVQAFAVEGGSGCRHDRLEYYNGANFDIAPLVFCGLTIPNIPTSTSNIVVLIFISDSTLGYAGFHFVYTSVNAGVAGLSNQSVRPPAESMTPSGIEMSSQPAQPAVDFITPTVLHKLTGKLLHTLSIPHDTYCIWNIVHYTPWYLLQMKHSTLYPMILIVYET